MERSLAVVALLLGCIALLGSLKTQADLDELTGNLHVDDRGRNTTESSSPPASPPADIELADVMAGVALRLSNLWYARTSGSKGLFDYERHEIMELFEEINEARPREAGRDVASELDRVLVQELPGLREALLAGDQTAYEKRFDGIVDGCNGCHEATGHPFIRIGRPEGPATGVRKIGR